MGSWSNSFSFGWFGTVSPPSPGQHPRSEFKVPAEEEINFISLPPGSQFKVSQD